MTIRTVVVGLAVVAVLLTANLAVMLGAGKADARHPVGSGVAWAQEKESEAPKPEEGLEGLGAMMGMGMMGGLFQGLLPGSRQHVLIGMEGKIFIASAGTLHKVDAQTMKLEGKVDFETPESDAAKLESWGKAMEALSDKGKKEEEGKPEKEKE